MTTLTGTELVEVTPLTSQGRPAAKREQVTTQQIANLGGSGSISNPINYTGDPTGLVLAISQAGLSIDGVFASGLAAQDFSETVSGLVTLNFGSTALILGGFKPVMSVLTSLNMSSVVAISAGIAANANFAPVLAALTTLNLSSLVSVGGSFIPNIPAITTLSLPALTFVGGNFQPVGSFTTVDVSALVKTGANMIFTSSQATLSMPNFTGNDFGAILPNVTSLSLPAYTTGGFAPQMNGLTSLSLPVWANDVATSAGGIFPNIPAMASAISFPALQTIIRGWSDGDYTLVPSFSLPAIVSIANGVDVETAANCTAVTLGATLKSVAGGFIFKNAKLTQANVNALLVQLAGLDGTGGTTLFQNQTVDLSGGTSGTPSGAGATAVTTLQGRGCTVTTN